jgi:hypothetical protein
MSTIPTSVTEKQFNEHIRQGDRITTDTLGLDYTVRTNLAETILPEQVKLRILS